jgi:hypothetical protein
MEMLTMSGLQTQREALFPYSTHRGVAKFVLSAQLNPTHIGKSFILYGEGKLASVRNPGSWIRIRIKEFLYF